MLNYVMNCLEDINNASNTFFDIGTTSELWANC